MAHLPRSAWPALLSLALGTVGVEAGCNNDTGSLPDGRPTDVDAPAGDTVDTVLDDAPPGATALGDATFTFHATVDATFACALDDAPMAACTSPTSVTVVEGIHTFRVVATDLNGVVDPEPAAVTWEVDQTAPETVLSAGPPPATDSAIAHLVFGPAAAGVTFECALDGGAFAPCTSPLDLTVTPGAHTLEVRAVDAAGNVDASPLSIAWTYDTTPIAVTITGGPDGYYTTEAAPTFTFDLAGAPTSVTCQLDAEPPVACASPVTSPMLLDGDHTFAIAALGSDGTPHLASRTFTVDTTPEPIWTLATVAAPPSGRAAQSVVYDEAHDAVLLIDGTIDSMGTFANDMWSWDGAAWTLLSPGTRPSPRWYPMVAFDPSSQQVILFGGNDAAYTLHNDTWAWDGTTWAELSPAHAPAARDMARLATDPARSKVVLFGGYANPNTLADTWEWDGADWTETTPAVSPSGRYLHTLTYDGAGVMLFGGWDAGGAFPRDTWRYDGTWTQITTVFSPPGRAMSFTSYDATLGRVRLFGGYAGAATNDTWEWTGAQWRPRTPVQAPTARWAGGQTTNTSAGLGVLFGGWDGARRNDTWTID